MTTTPASAVSQHTRTRALEDLAASRPGFVQLSDDGLKARSLAGFPKLALWLLRDGRNPERLLGSFDTWSATMMRVLEAPVGIDAFASLVTYMFRVIGPVNWAALHAKLRHMSAHAEKVAMTIADQLHEEGRMEGRMEGRVDTLRSLLLYKFKLPALDSGYESRLKTAMPDVIDRYLQRVLFAETLAAVFDG